MSIDWQQVHGAIWHTRRQALRAVAQLDPVRLEDLVGVENQARALVANTLRFAGGEPANNALLWGARGTGKSAVVKAVINTCVGKGVRVVQVDRDDLAYLPDIVGDLRAEPWRYIVFCDDLSFDAGDSGYRGLKTVLEGSIEQPAENVRVYATSNRRHLVPEFASDNNSAKVVETEIHYGDEVEEKISLADRFGLWLSFYPISQDHYLAIVDHLFAQAGDISSPWERHPDALRYAQEKGGRSGRTARQFFNTVYKKNGSNA